MMKYSEFIAETYKLVADFHLVWARGNEVDPDAFPLEMEAGDWDQQFFSFMEMREENGDGDEG